MIVIFQWDTGWWFQPLIKKIVKWDDCSQYMESHKIHVPNHQPDYHLPYLLVVGVKENPLFIDQQMENIHGTLMEKMFQTTNQGYV